MTHYKYQFLKHCLNIKFISQRPFSPSILGGHKILHSVSPSINHRVSNNHSSIQNNMAIVEEGFVVEKETHLTVMKTSLFFSGDGFAVYDCNGQLVFRVDSYSPEARDSGELVLMDPNGRCLLTVRRKRPSLHQRWEGFLGESNEGEKPIFSVSRSSIIGRSNMTVELFDDRTDEYNIEGHFGNRNCTIYDSAKEILAEIRRKVDATTNVMLGKDVFSLTLKPGFDGAFAMGLVLVLDQINGDDEGDDEAVDIDLTADDCNISS